MKKISLLYSRFNQDAIALAVLLLPILIWLYKLLLPKSFWFWGDIAFYFYPITKTGMDQWHSGIIPLWSNLVQCGFPMLADGQGALLYPLNFIFYFIFSATTAHNLSILFQVMLTACFMYFFLRKLSISRLSAIIAGWIWVFAGPIGTSIGSPALNTLTWWPLLFILAEYLVHNVKWHYVASIGLVTGLMWLGGFPQTAFYGIFAATAYFFTRSIVVHWKNRKTCALLLSMWLAALIIGFGVAAIQLLPTWEMALYSIRAHGTDYAFATQASMFPSGYLNLLLPDWLALRDYQLAGCNNLFVGAICLTFIIISIRSNFNKSMLVFFWGLLVFSSFFAVGKYNPAYHLLYAFPGFNNFRNPSRLLYLMMFSMAILSGIGFDSLFCAGKTFLHTKRAKKILVLLVAATSIISVGGTCVLHVTESKIITLVQNYTFKNELHQKYKMQSKDYYIAKVNTMVKIIHKAISPISANFIISLTLALFGILLLLLNIRQIIPAEYIRVLLFIFASVNILLIWHEPLSTATIKAVAATPASRFFAQQKQPYRIYNLNSQSELITNPMQFERFDPNYNMLFTIPHVGVYGALSPIRYYELMGSLGTVNLALSTPPVSIDSVIKHRNILNLLNVRYIINNDMLNQSYFSPVVPFKKPYIFENKEALPQAFVAPQAQFASNAVAVLDSMHSLSFNPAKTVYVESEPISNSPQGDTTYNAVVDAIADQHWEIHAQGPGWLVVTDLFYPGWQATVDGKPTKIYRGDYVFKTLPLSAGIHKVELTFVSSTFKRGFRITLVAIAAILFLYFSSILHRLQRRKNIMTKMHS